jgi:hypothetical protein
MDNASDPAYADGWQAGDNGGSGFTPWNFDSGYIFAGTNYTYAAAGTQTIDDGLQNGGAGSSPFNNIGKAWTLGATANDDGAAHIGRGFSLGIGETLKVVIDNPTKRKFFKGYFVRLNGDSGGSNGNICNLGYGCSHPNFPDGYPVPKTNIGTFEYFTNGAWFVDDATGTSPGVIDTDTAAAGALFSVKRTGANTYDLLMDSLGGGADYGPAPRTFHNAGAAVDWIEFVFFPGDNGFSDPTMETDFYISSMMIVPEPGTAALLLLGATGAVIGTARRRRNDK